MAMARPSTLEGRLLAILDGARNRRNLTRMGVLAVSALLVLVITPLACMHATQAAHAEQAQITGLVVASDGQPVQNAQIELRVDGADGNSTTDSTAPSGTGGTFALPLKNPTAAKGQVYAFVPGAGISLPILLPTEGSPRLTLMPAVDVHITLLAPDGKPAQESPFERYKLSFAPTRDSINICNFQRQHRRVSRGSPVRTEAASFTGCPACARAVCRG